MKEFQIQPESFSIQTKNGVVYCWQIDDFEQKLKKGEKKRSIEKEAVLNKLCDLGFNNLLQYKENGQPFLANKLDVFISISHSKSQIVLFLASRPVGVDIEIERPRLYEGRSYFVNEYEEKGDLSQETLQLIWGGKEAIYKQFEGQIEDLKNEVTLLTVNQSNKTIEFTYETKIVKLGYMNIGTYWLVYSLD